MNPNPIAVPNSESLTVYNGKHLRFHLKIDDTGEAAEGIGTLHVTPSDIEGHQEALLTADVWPKQGFGTAVFHHYYLTASEVGWIRPAPTGDEIECNDPALRSNLSR